MIIDANFLVIENTQIREVKKSEFIEYLIKTDRIDLLRKLEKIVNKQDVIWKGAATWEWKVSNLKGEYQSVLNKGYEMSHLVVINQLLYKWAIEEKKGYIDLAGYRKNGMKDMLNLLRNRNKAMKQRNKALIQIMRHGRKKIVPKLKNIYQNDQSLLGEIKMELKKTIELLEKGK